MTDGWTSNIVQKFYGSPAWSKAYNLPIVPRTNNPFLYGAYCMKVMSFAGMNVTDAGNLWDLWDDYLLKCTVSRGLYNRKPDGSGGVTSHDELLGIAYIFTADIAADILFELEQKDGIYCNVASEWLNRGADIEKYNLNRFVWLKPYLKAASGQRVGLVSQLIWSSHIFIDAMFSKTGDAGGKLRNWIMFDAMEDLFLCRIAIKFWAWKMKKKNVTLRSCLRIEPAEAQILYETAGDKWI